MMRGATPGAAQGGTHASRPRGARGVGAAGEDRAAAWLEARGWRIMARNFRSPAGEIDIIAEKDSQIAFIEVKAWRTLPSSELEYSIDARKQSRIARAARSWLSANRIPAGRRLRFDVIFLSGADGSRTGGPAEEIRHIEDAFSGGID